MGARNRKTASVRLTDEHYVVMESLGINNESAYLKYIMDKGQTKLDVLKTEVSGHQLQTLPATTEKRASESAMEDKLTIQRLAMENSQLQDKLEAIDKNNRDTLNGVSGQVHSMLQEELRKRDFETLQKDHAMRGDKMKQLEEDLEKSKKETEAKQTEIEALVKKLGFVELGKALLPGAISGLAKQYPKQMQGIAGTLGRLGLNESPDGTDINLDEDRQQLLQIAEYLQELFTEEQFEQVVQLIIQVGDHIKEDDNLIQKLAYFLNKSPRSPKGGQNGIDKDKDTNI